MERKTTLNEIPIVSADVGERSTQKQAWLEQQKMAWLDQRRGEWEATGKQTPWAEWIAERELQWWVNELPNRELRWRTHVADYGVEVPSSP